jgi:tRNA(Ile)-lysidine synthase
MDDCINDPRSVRVKRRLTVERKVERWLHRREVDGGGIVVAVSGGADSVALTRALLAVRAPKADKPMILAHLNHRLRGDESNGDEAFVQAVHARLAQVHPHLGLHSESLPVADQARAEQGNLEAVARRLRYEWLTNVARENGARWIATGHTSDDQAETVLHRLLRGAGLQGLRGIAAQRSLTPEITLIRPQLDVTRNEVVAYLETLGQNFREDSSNQDLSFTRNRLRHKLLPQLARYNPAIARVLCRLAEQADQAYVFVAEQAQSLLREAERPPAGSMLVFDRAVLRGAPRRLVREMFRLVWARKSWPTGRMSFAAWDRLADVAQGDATDLDLPGGIRARGRERVVQLERTS